MIRRLLGALLAAALLLPQIAPAAGQAGQPAQDVHHRYPSISVGGNANAVAVQGSLAYVGEGSKLTVVDTSDPQAPLRLGSVDLSGPVTAVKVAGTRAYAITQVFIEKADPRNQMSIIDVRNPAAPSIISSVRLGKGGQSLDVAGNLVYVGRGLCCIAGLEDSGLIVFDTTNVLSPTVRTAFVTGNLINAMRVVGTKVYMINHKSLTILDASVSPAAVIGDFTLESRALDMAVAGDYAYVITESPAPALEVLDIRTPNAIQRADSLGLTYPFDTLAVENDRAYLFGGSHTVDNDEIRVIDISDPRDVSLIDSGAGGFNAADVVVAGSVAYLADRNGGLRLFDVSDPAAIDELGRYLLSPAPIAFWGDGERAYVSDATSRMSASGTVSIIDHSGPQPAEVGSLNQRTKVIKVIGGTAYMLTDQGLRIADVSDPAQPEWLGAIDIPDPAFLEVRGDNAYVTSMYSPTLSVIDISQPLNPTLRGQYSTPRQVYYGLWVEGGKAYVMSAKNGLMILDVQNPGAIAQVGSYLGWSAIMDIDGTTAYMYQEKSTSSAQYAVDIVALGNPAAPALMATYDLKQPAKAILVEQGRAFVAARELNTSPTVNFSAAIQILDVSDPAQPRLKEWIASNGDPAALNLIGNKLYVNEKNNGFRVMDVTPQADPQRIFLPLLRR
ncbi:MAG TPA: hypothetical protein VD886_13150 [Herpetosiphonaceae bacterium]|nr:hypothetical protein [Herpetosiphonaceae bacterium]